MNASFWEGMITLYLIIGLVCTVFGWLVDKPWLPPNKYKNKRVKYYSLLTLDTLGSFLVWPFYVARALKGAY